MHKGDPLFAIDPRPYQIRLDQAVAQLQTAQAKEVADRRRAVARAAAEAHRLRHGRERRSARRRRARARRRRSRRPRRPIMDAQLDLEFAQRHRAVHRADRRASRLRRQPGQRQPRRRRPDDAAGDDRLARPDLSRFRHERGGLPAPISRPTAAPAPHGRRRDQPGRRRPLRPPRHARLHRQRASTAAAARSMPAPPCPTRTWRSRPASSPGCAWRSAQPGAGAAGARRRRRARTSRGRS